MTVATQNKRTVVKSALKIVPVANLQVDPSYQRDVKAKHKRIVADFNEEALGIPLVGEREDGGLWIVDGLQRITALKKLGRKDVRAEVFASRGPEHEAEVFKLVNLNRTKLTSAEQFRAMLTCHDELSWKIKEAVESCGYKIVLGKTGSKGGNADEQASFQLTCISTLVTMADRHGVDPIKFALNCIKESWPNDRMGTNNGIVSGLGCFYRRNDGVVDLERLIPRLQTATPHKIIYAANQATLSNNRVDAIADVLEKLYRKRLKKA